MKPTRSCSLLLAVAVAAPGLSAQYNERPEMLGSGLPACDASGRSIKDKRVRAIHTTDPNELGGTAYLLQRDPFLAYQLGRDLNFREFRERDGTFDAHVSNLAGPMPDGTTAKITANNQTSCVGCHNLPQGNPGGGTNFHKDSGRGRQAPHYYGGGIVEMLALQVRAEMLHQVDTNRDGWVSAAEATAAPRRLLVRPTAGGTPIDYGNPRLDGGRTGRPQLDNIFRVWFVDERGRVVRGATSVDGSTTFGYGFEMVVWGWGQGRGRSGLNPTNRAFLWDPFKAHGGLESFDPSTTDDPDGNGVSAPTLAGAIQFPVTHRPADAGNTLDPLGFSRDDPDRDGHLTEISEGDLDLAEWFMLNAPRPAFAGTEKEFQEGMREFERAGCNECHVANWTIAAQNTNPQRGPQTDGDRRLFDLDVRWNEQNRRLEGRLVPLYDRRGERFVPRRDAFEVVGFFSDLRQHDLGASTQELDFGGNVNRLWRTPILWGVGSGFPWLHDGSAITIEDAILRHGGEATASRIAYERLGNGPRDRLLSFLNKLVLYDIESLPSDIDGDGRISEHFTVAGMDTGTERFNAEWLFLTPLRIQGPFVNTDNVMIRSFAGTNIPAAYGFDLRLRRDSDNDGWPDVWDHAPNQPGFRDGVN